jgi:hypothetical protein
MNMMKANQSFDGHYVPQNQCIPIFLSKYFDKDISPANTDPVAKIHPTFNTSQAWERLRK